MRVWVDMIVMDGVIVAIEMMVPIQL